VIVARRAPRGALAAALSNAASFALGLLLDAVVHP